MRHAMKTVTPNPMFFGEIVVDRISRGGGRQGRVKCRIEDRRHAHRRAEDFSRRMNAAHCHGIVQRREIIQRLDLSEHFVIESHGAGEYISAMHHTMTDGIDPPSARAGRI